MSSFKFQIGQQVKLSLSNETGQVIGRAEYQHASNSYYVRYVTTDGRQIEDWISEPALVEA